MIAQNNGVCFAMDFCCNNEAKQILFARHASEQLSRMSEALGAGGCRFTRSLMRFSIVERMIWLAVHDVLKLNNQEWPLPTVESECEQGATGAFLLLDEDCVEDEDVTGFAIFSPRRWDEEPDDADSSVS